jgi:AcrR family transcriptional regulator
MSAIRSATAPAPRSFIETARRAQIVDAAITTIAEMGIASASYARIAKRAGLSSTGLISYHFENREELLGEVVSTVVAAIGEHMAHQLRVDVSNAGEALRRYILGNVEFIDSHRREMKALLEVFIGGGFEYGAEEEEHVLSPLEAILRRGQREGTFRRFDVRVMAALIQRAIDGLPFLLASDPELDVDRYGLEAATTFDLATRRQGP